jgi:peptidoglycan/LPS O-acetylase OafA/YrhL
MKLNYRPEIDGLRAIAVVSVVIYHAQIFFLDNKIFEGGFIGVDVFFVISGYLITSIIYKELVTTGSFSFKYFYGRRIRRILPALLFVILISLPFAWIYLLPHSLIDFSESILYSLGFSSNVYFWYSGQQYGAESSLLKPFLHTWSLSVEEQYYILFPIILLITFKYFKKYLIHILVLGFFISILAAEWGSRNYPTFNFYVLPTRGWELLAGSILAYFEITLGHRNKNKKLTLVLPSVGLILIMHSMLFFPDFQLITPETQLNDEIFHPSFYTLSPIIGVCLIIWFSNKDELITKILSSKLFVGTGLISYSLYLWHFPIFAFGRTTGFLQEDDTSIKLMLGLIIIIISILSYFFIERPFRNRKYKFTLIIKILVTIILFIFIFNITSIYKKGFEKRSHFPELIVNAYKTIGYRNSMQNGIKCDDRIGEDGFCIFNELQDNVGDIILLGDSMADALLKSLREQVSNTKFRLITMSHGGYFYLPNFIKYDDKKKVVELDETVNQYRSDFIENKTHKNTYIIMYAKYSSVFGKELKLEGETILKNETLITLIDRKNINLSFDDKKKLLKKKFKNSIINLSKDNKIILLYPTPVSPEHVFYRVLGSKSKLINPDFEIYQNNPDYYLTDKINYPVQIYREFFSEEISLLDSINSKNIYKIKLEKTFCPANQCFFYDNKKIYIYDTHHPSYEGSKKINKLIMKEINQSLVVNK